MQREPALVKQIQRTTSQYQGGRTRSISASKDASKVHAIDSDDSAQPPDPVATVSPSDEPVSAPVESSSPVREATTNHPVIRRIEGDFDDAESLCDIALDPMIELVDVNDCGQGAKRWRYSGSVLILSHS